MFERNKERISSLHPFGAAVSIVVHPLMTSSFSTLRFEVRSIYTIYPYLFITAVVAAFRLDIYLRMWRFRSRYVWPLSTQYTGSFYTPRQVDTHRCFRTLRASSPSVRAQSRVFQGESRSSKFASLASGVYSLVSAWPVVHDHACCEAASRPLAHPMGRNFVSLTVDLCPSWCSKHSRDDMQIASAQRCLFDIQIMKT